MSPHIKEKNQNLVEIEYYAHSANKTKIKHTIKEHLTSVANLINQFLQDSSLLEEAKLAGLLHDFGKYGDLFQKRLIGMEKGIDHWSAGAWKALQEFRAVAAALAIEGHHIGLQDCNLDHLRSLNPERLKNNHPLRLQLSEADANILKSRFEQDEIKATVSKRLFEGELKTSAGSMLDIRLIFSALVDADFIDTEAHFNGDEEGKKYRPQGLPLQANRALEILKKYIEKLGSESKASTLVKKVRTCLMNDCDASVNLEGNLFTLTAPTGSGKTLSMLLFSLKQAIARDLKRIIIVLPYLSIIEQTASIYRQIFEPHYGAEYILEHHSLADAGAETHKSNNGEQIAEAEALEGYSRLLSENWDAPVIITTSVQFFESLFSNKPSACRKLHRLRNAVIMFDEVQTLPINLALPTLAALSHLTQNHNSTIVFASATQPAFEHLNEHIKSYFMEDWQPKEIVSNSKSFFKILKRVEFFWDDPEKKKSWDELANTLKDHEQVLCILNIKRHARMLWEKLGEGAFHLSTNLCPAHRKNLLKTVSDLIKIKKPVRLVATQCIEAGVDIDFPVVYRAYGPLDSIIQAAGRCNREGILGSSGKVFVFQPFIEENETEYPDPAYSQAAQITKMLVKGYGCNNMDMNNPEFIASYYRELYNLSRPETMERTKKLYEYIKAGSFPYVAKEYKLIKKDALNVVVPYSGCMDVFESLLDEANKIGLTSKWIKRARPISINIYRPRYDDPIWNYLIPVKVAGKTEKEYSDWFIYIKKDDYHPMLGLVPSGAPDVWIA